MSPLRNLTGSLNNSLLPQGSYLMGCRVYKVLGTLYRLMVPGSTNRDICYSFDLSSRHYSSQLDRMSILQGGRRSLLLTALLTCLLGAKSQPSGVQVSLGRFLAGHSPHPAPRPGLLYPLAPHKKHTQFQRTAVHGSRESCELGTVPLLWASAYTSMKSVDRWLI